MCWFSQNTFIMVISRYSWSNSQNGRISHKLTFQNVSLNQLSTIRSCSYLLLQHIASLQTTTRCSGCVLMPYTFYWLIPLNIKASSRTKHRHRSDTTDLRSFEFRPLGKNSWCCTDRWNDKQKVFLRVEVELGRITSSLNTNLAWFPCLRALDEVAFERACARELQRNIYGFSTRNHEFKIKLPRYNT